MKKMALLGLVIFLTISCTKTNQESHVSGVSATPCVQTKAGDGHSDRVDVEFTEKGVQITHYGFEVTCDFTTVNVTHTFLNGVLNITQQGTPNQARCKCYTDVSYTIEGMSKNEVNVIFINGKEVYCYNNSGDNRKECEEVACAKIFVQISFKLKYPDGQPVLLDSSKVFWVSQNRYLEQNLFSWNEARVWGNYVIVNDLMRKELYNKKEEMRFTGYLGGETICEWDVLVGADCCHVCYLGTESLTQVIPFISIE